MALVVFSGGLEDLTGKSRVRVGSKIFKDVIDELLQEFSKLDRHVLEGMAVAIDGEIIHSPYLETLRVDSELHFIHKISGG